MKVILYDHTKLSNAVIAGRTAYNSFKEDQGNYPQATNDLTQKDINFLDKLVNRIHHTSVVEQINYNFKIDGFSRAVLQQLSRHRHASQTVQSTRYCKPNDFELYKTGDKELDEHIQNYFDETRIKFKHLKNDVLKYAYPEAVLTKNVYCLNMRELLHIAELRCSSKALAEFQILASKLLDAIPETHKFLFKKYLKT